MNNNVKIILMDDIHLEGRKPEQIESFKCIVQDKITEVKSSGMIPILVCAGDIGEGVAGIQWTKNYDCEVIYTCGNHEFWNRDFFETYSKIYEELKKPEYAHVHFLNNSTVILHNIRFIGGTMWTNVGEFLNWYDKKNLAVKYFPIMGDFKKITIKGWYSDINIQKLKSFLHKNIVQMTPIIEEQIETLIENEYFNPLFELEEYQKTVNYINDELNQKFSGKTVVVTHHLPDFNNWASAKKMNMKVLEGEYLNNDRLLLEGAKGQNKMYRDAMLIGYYSNDLKALMFGENSPDYWFHGHLHVPVLSIVGRTKILSSPVGYHTQSSVMLMKECSIHNPSQFIGAFIKKKVEEYDWESKILNPINDLEDSINTFESLVKSNFVSAIDFKVILNSFKNNHQISIDELKKEVSRWLSPLIFEQEISLPDKELDYFNVVLKSGILNTKSIGLSGDLIKFKIPDYLTMDIGENSFKNTDDFNNNTSLTFWRSEIQKIHQQVKNLKKVLNDFSDNLKNI